MGFLKNIKVRTKLIISFIVVAILVGVVGTIGMMSLKTVDINSEDMYTNSLQSVYMLTDMRQNLTEIRDDVIELLYVRDESKKADLEKDIQINADEDDKYITDYEKLSMNDIEKQIWPTYKNQIEQYRILRGNVIKLVDGRNFDEAVKQYQQIPAISELMMANLDKLINENLDSAKTTNLNNHSIYLNSNNSMMILMITGLIIAIGLGLFMANDINNPLLKIKFLAESIAEFDFSVPIIITRRDEFGQIGNALNTSIKNVSSLVNSIVENAQDMSASSEELSATAEEITAKVEEIDSAIVSITSGIQATSATSEEITASVEEVDSSINELSGKAMEGSNNANQSKERATEVEKKGKRAIKEVRIYMKKRKRIC